MTPREAEGGLVTSRANGERVGSRDALPGPGSRDPGAPPPGGDALRAVDEARVRAVGEAHLRRVREVSDAFFEAHAEDVSRACWDMARRFRRGGRLLVFGGAGSASDVFHVSVEFVHPVIVGKRALPALALEGDLSAHLRLLARESDIAMGIRVGEDDGRVRDGLRQARRKGMLTIALVGEGGETPAAAASGDEGGAGPGRRVDHLFAVSDPDPTVVQEVHETLYHVLWELVHVFFEHEGMA